MFRAIDTETGEIVYLDRAIFEAECPNCEKMHEVDLNAILKSKHTDLHSTKVLCSECSALHRGGNGHACGN